MSSTCAGDASSKWCLACCLYMCVSFLDAKQTSISTSSCTVHMPVVLPHTRKSAAVKIIFSSIVYYFSCSVIITFVTGPAKIDHVSTKNANFILS